MELTLTGLWCQPFNPTDAALCLYCLLWPCRCLYLTNSAFDQAASLFQTAVLFPLQVSREMMVGVNSTGRFHQHLHRRRWGYSSAYTVLVGAAETVSMHCLETLLLPLSSANRQDRFWQALTSASFSQQHHCLADGKYVTLVPIPWASPPALAWPHPNATLQLSSPPMLLAVITAGPFYQTMSSESWVVWVVLLTPTKFN